MSSFRVKLYVTLFLTSLLCMGTAQAQFFCDAGDPACVEFVQNCPDGATLSGTMSLESGVEVSAKIECEGDWSVEMGAVLLQGPVGEFAVSTHYLFCSGLDNPACLSAPSEEAETAEFALQNVSVNFTERELKVKAVSGDEVKMTFERE